MNIILQSDLISVLKHNGLTCVPLSRASLKLAICSYTVWLDRDTKTQDSYLDLGKWRWD